MSVQALLYTESRGRLGAPPTFPQDVQPGRGEPGMLVSVQTLAADPEYHNPSPVVWLIGHAHEAMAVVEGWRQWYWWILGPKSLPLPKVSAQILD